jgi:dTDP-4-dehydrorhamnose reductase
LVRTNPGHLLSLHTHVDGDIADESGLSRWVADARPQWILNTVAYNRTEDAETVPETAFRTNALGPRAVARAAETVGARVIHFSTDFVFDGEKGAPYVESDVPRPLSVYAVSKRAGEDFIRAANPSHLVVRTSSLFGATGSSGKGGNFVEFIRQRARSGGPLRVISDIRMCPTYTVDLAVKVWELLSAAAPGGFYHLANTGVCSWHEFAQAIVRGSGLSVPVDPILATDWPSKIRRGPNTALASERLSPLGLAPLRPWPDALAAYLAAPRP